MHAKDEKVYLSEVKRNLEVHTDSVSLVALKYGQHIKAYNAAIEDQKYLRKGGLQVKVLARAFRAFPNLKEVTIDDGNYGIGSRQLLRDFGAFKTADILTFNGVNTVPSLIRALADGDVPLSVLRIGFQHDLDMSDYPPELFSYSSRLSYRGQLCAKAMSSAFCDPETKIHANRVLQQLRTLEISELEVQDSRSDLLKMAMAIESLIISTPKLESVNIMEISCRNKDTDMQALSVEDLFSSHVRHHNLRFVTLHCLFITNHLTLVSFIKVHARSLEAVVFIYFGLEDVK